MEVDEICAAATRSHLIGLEIVSKKKKEIRHNIQWNLVLLDWIHMVLAGALSLFA